MFQITPKLTVDLPFGDWQATGMFNYGRSATIGFQRTVNTGLLGQAMRRTTVAGVQTPALVASPVSPAMRSIPTISPPAILR